jgi:hypothetical protein
MSYFLATSNLGSGYSAAAIFPNLHIVLSLLYYVIFILALSLSKVDEIPVTNTANG